ncbi:MAG: DUF1934 domain-containing protein [Oscillospiraceae bacterium]|nr:DUF1934 domain-containing protein [Oscillospiraceae bacterium]
MKKEALISIKGIYGCEGDSPEVIEMFTTGSYFKKGEAYHICYNESEATGYGDCRTTVIVEGGTVRVERTGGAGVGLVVQKGVRHQSRCNMGYGDMTIGVSGSSVTSTLGERGGNVSFRYSLDINSLLASENEMYIHVYEQ